jgi:hypothetical protein
LIGKETLVNHHATCLNGDIATLEDARCHGGMARDSKTGLRFARYSASGQNKV